MHVAVFQFLEVLDGLGGKWTVAHVALDRRVVFVEQIKRERGVVLVLDVRLRGMQRLEGYNLKLNITIDRQNITYLVVFNDLLQLDGDGCEGLDLYNVPLVGEAGGVHDA